MNQSYLNCINSFDLQLHFMIIETVNNWASWLQCYLTGSVSRYEYLCISMLVVGVRTFLTFLETVYRTAAPLPPLRTVYAHRSCCFVASLPAFKIWAYLTQNLMWGGGGESKGGREFYVPQNANCALCDRGWSQVGGGRFCHCLRYNNFLGPGKVSCLVHAASGGYLQHFCGTWLHAGRLWQLWQPFGGQNQTSLEQESVNCSYWLCVLCIELGSTTVGESRRGKQLAVSLDDCKQLCDGLKVGLGGEVIGR